MTAQTVNTREVGMMDSLYSVSSNSGKKTSGAGGFQDFMNQNLSSGKNNYVKQNDLSDQIAPVKNSRLDDRMVDSGKKISVSENSNTANTSKTEQSGFGKTMDEQISALESKIKDVIKEALGLSDKELEEAMSVLGINFMQLLQPDALKDLALYVNGETDITAVLTNEELASDIMNLLQKVSEIDLSEFGITEGDLEVLLKQYEESMLNNHNVSEETEEEANVNVKENAGAMAVEEADLPEDVLKQRDYKVTDTEETEVSTDSGQITVEVTKESESSGSNTEHKQNNNQPADSNNPNNVINNMTGSQIQNVDELAEQAMKIAEAREIVNQVVDEIKVTIKPSATSMELQLNPENLGKVNLTVVSKDGIMTAQFRTENLIAKEALESQLHTLKETFAQQNIKVEAIEVTVSTNFEFGQSGQAGKEEQEQKGSGKKNISFDDLDSMDAMTEEEELAVNMMLQNGNSLDYSV